MANLRHSFTTSTIQVSQSKIIKPAVYVNKLQVPSRYHRRWRGGLNIDLFSRKPKGMSTEYLIYITVLQPGQFRYLRVK